MAQVDGNYFLCDMDQQMVSLIALSVSAASKHTFSLQELASKLSSISMPMMDHFYFSMAPVDLNKSSVVTALRQVIIIVTILFLMSVTCDANSLQSCTHLANQ